MEFDFATSVEVPEADFTTKVPTDFQGLYKKVENKYVLDSEHTGVKSAVAAITRLNVALKSERKNKPAVVDLTPLKEFGEDPTKILETVQERIKTLTDANKGINVDKIKKDLETEWRNKVTTSEDRAKRLEEQLFGTLVEGDAAKAIADEKGDLDLLMPFVKRQVRTVVQDGKYVVQVVDDNGDVRYNGATGSPLKVAELVKQMKANAKYGRLFQSEAASGGGTKPGSTSRTPAAGGAAASDRSSTQKIADGLKKSRG